MCEFVGVSRSCLPSGRFRPSEWTGDDRSVRKRERGDLANVVVHSARDAGFLPLGAHVQAQGCIRREGTSEAAPEAVTQAVGGGCQSGWGRLSSFRNAIQAGIWRQGDSGWVKAGRPGGAGFTPPPPSNASLCTPLLP